MRALLILAIGGVLATACGNSVPSAASATAVNKVSGDNQSGNIGSPLAQAMVVKVVDKNGTGVPGVGVTWAVATGNGQIVSVQDKTNGDGNSAAIAVPGAAANTYTATAGTLTGSPITFTATGTGSGGGQIAKAAGDAQTGVVNVALTTALKVKVTDIGGNPLANVSIAFAAATGGGSITPATATTAADGTASATATLGKNSGAQSFTATATFGAVTFTATASPGPAATLSLVSGDTQSASARAALALPLTVKVVDAFGNPVADKAVAFAAVTGGGTLSAASANSKPDGTASVTATLGPTLGPSTFSATVTGATGSPLTFTASGKGLLASPVGDGQTTVSGDPAPLSLTVTDYAGLGLPNATVNWSVSSGDGTLSAATSTTNASGVATIIATAGSTIGDDVFQAQATGTGTLLFRVHASKGLRYTPPAAGGKVRVVKNAASTSQVMVLDVVANAAFTGYGVALNLPANPAMVRLDSLGFIPGTAFTAGPGGAQLPTQGPLAGVLVSGQSQKGSATADSAVTSGTVLYTLQIERNAAAPRGVIFDGANLGTGYRAAVRDHLGTDVVLGNEFSIGKLEAK